MLPIASATEHRSIHTEEAMQDFRLHVFRTVAEKLSFTHAAELLYLTQPAVTQQIKVLETDLGVRLFDRAGGKVQLTPAGEVLLHHARRIAALYEEAQREIGQVQLEQRGRLRIGASTTVSQYILPRLMPALLRRHAQLQIAVVSGNTERVVHLLQEGEIEVGLVEGPPGSSDVRARKFLEDELVLVTAPGHAWARAAKEGIPAEWLQHEPLILREHGSGTRRVIETALKKAGLKLPGLRVVLELDSTEAIKLAVQEQLGVALVSRWAILGERQSGALREIPIRDLRLRRWLQSIYPQGPLPEGPAAAFLDLLRTAVPQLAAMASAQRESSAESGSGSSGKKKT